MSLVVSQQKIKHSEALEEHAHEKVQRIMDRYNVSETSLDLTIRPEGKEFHAHLYLKDIKLAPLNVSATSDSTIKAVDAVCEKLNAKLNRVYKKKLSGEHKHVSLKDLNTPDPTIEEPQEV